MIPSVLNKITMRKVLFCVFFVGILLLFRAPSVNALCVTIYDNAPFKTGPSDNFTTLFSSVANLQTVPMPHGGNFNDEISSLLLCSINEGGGCNPDACGNFTGITQCDGSCSVTTNACTPPAPIIQVLSPNGGEIWPQGSTQNVRWTSSDIPQGARVTAVTIILTDPSGTSDYVNLTPSPAPNVESGNASIPVSDNLTPGSHKIWIYILVDGAFVKDFSDEPFTISAATQPPPPDCNTDISCSGSCAGAAANTCSTGNGAQGGCKYTKYNSGPDSCTQVAAPNQSCTQPNCTSPNTCSSGVCTCTPDQSCSAPVPACGKITTGVNSCGGTCSRTGPACPPTTDIKANNADGPISVPYNSSVHVTWSSTDADSCTVTFSDAGGSWSGTSGDKTHNLVAARTYTLACTGAGGSASDKVTVKILPPTLSFFADKTRLPYDGASTLRWTVNGASSCKANAGNNDPGFTGAADSSDGDHSYATGNLIADLCYGLSCGNPSGNSPDRQVCISVAPPSGPSGIIRIKRVGKDSTLATVPAGTQTRLASHPNNVFTVNPAEITTAGAHSDSADSTNLNKYDITAGSCTYAASSPECSVSSFVNTSCNSSFCSFDLTTADTVVQKVVFKYVHKPIKINFTASPSLISFGQSSNLIWSVSNASRCTASAYPSTGQWAGDISLSSPPGGQRVSPLSTTVYTLTCSDAGVSASASAAITSSKIREIPP